MYFLIFSFCTYIISINFEDSPENLLEEAREMHECDEEHIDDFITDDKNRHPNITTIDTYRKTPLIVFTQVGG